MPKQPPQEGGSASRGQDARDISSPGGKPKALHILSPHAYGLLYKDLADETAELVDVYAPPQTTDSVAKDPAVLRPMEILLTGWGGPKMDAAFLAAAPNLKAVFYAAGSIRPVVTDAFWDRNIPIASAWVANGVPVAEYTLAQVLWLLRKGWHFALQIREQKAWPREKAVIPGSYGTTVGIVSLGVIGRRVCQLLKSFELKVIAYDPFVKADAARELGVELVGLDDLFRRADVVSLHTPWLKETEGMITGAHFRMMKKDASFINTARGAVVRENEMIEALRQRPDIWAVLDVTYPEPPAAGSPLYTLPNVIMTPHIAGPMNAECARNGRYMLADLRRFLAGQPMEWAIDRQRAATMA